MEDTEMILNEAINVPKIEFLARLGLLPLNVLPYLRKTLDRIESGTALTMDDRKIIKMLMNKLVSLTLDDSMSYQRLRLLVTQQRNNTMNNPIKEDKRREDMKKMPEGMLDTLATNIRVKVRSGGKVSVEDKRMASRAKAELRRRRDNAKKESYQHAFDAVLDTYGISSIAQLSEEQLKEFFNNVEALYNSGE
jgi:hypothetical protein